MLIDFHVHIYPDALAKKALPVLSKKAGIPYHGLGTKADLEEKMTLWGLDALVIANVATNIHQEQDVNDFAISIDSPTMHSLGSVYPGSPRAIAELERIKAAGLKGIKLHPEYQDFDIHDSKAYPIYEKCGELGLFILFHAGRDRGFPDTYRAKPEYLARAAEDFPQNTFIAAHWGGFGDWDKVESLLCGRKNLYFDTSHICENLSPEQALRLVRKHGAERILFASDYPWTTVPMIQDFLLTLGLTEEEKRLIEYANAAALLGI